MILFVRVSVKQLHPFLPFSLMFYCLLWIIELFSLASSASSNNFYHLAFRIKPSSNIKRSLSTRLPFWILHGLGYQQPSESEGTSLRTTALAPILRYRQWLLLKHLYLRRYHIIASVEWRFFSVTPQSHAMVKQDIITDFGRFSYDYMWSMKILPDFCSGCISIPVKKISSGY